RNTSPDRVSTTSSNVTAATTPQLRKKPNLRTLKISHHTRSVDESPSISTPPEESSRVQQQPLLSRANSVPSPQRRPPASHSSYGVETRSGPPPSYTTQITLSQDRIRPTERRRSKRMSLGHVRGPGAIDFDKDETIPKISDAVNAGTARQ